MGADVTRCDRQDGRDSGASSVPEEDYYHGPWATPHAHGGFPNENVWGIPTFLAISAIGDFFVSPTFAHPSLCKEDMRVKALEFFLVLIYFSTSPFSLVPM